MYAVRRTLGVVASLAVLAGGASANILGHHALTWWSDPNQGIVITQLGAPPPSAAAIQLLDLEEWHLDQAQTTQWYAGAAIGGLPANPFNAANRSGMTPGSAIVPVNGAEAFIYKITNWFYGSGNGFPFSDPQPPGPGMNYLSGINISDTHGALNITPPAAGSQFMFTDHGAGAKILDLTPGRAPATPQDWDFNAFSGPGSFEWDIDLNQGAFSGVIWQGGIGIFGYAMPGNWLDAVNDGWVHSWSNPMPPNPSVQVNIAFGVGGFSGPMIPEPATLGLLAVGMLCLARRR